LFIKLDACVHKTSIICCRLKEKKFRGELEQGSKDERGEEGWERMI
jgi:hypothetical protein